MWVVLGFFDFAVLEMLGFNVVTLHTTDDDDLSFSGDWCGIGGSDVLFLGVVVLSWIIIFC